MNSAPCNPIFTCSSGGIISGSPTSRPQLPVLIGFVTDCYSLTWEHPFIKAITNENIKGCCCCELKNNYHNLSYLSNNSFYKMKEMGRVSGKILVNYGPEIHGLICIFVFVIELCKSIDDN